MSGSGLGSDTRVRVRLLGRLGNQLFQVAAALKLQNLEGPVRVYARPEQSSDLEQLLGDAVKARSPYRLLRFGVVPYFRRPRLRRLVLLLTWIPRRLSRSRILYQRPEDSFTSKGSSAQSWKRPPVLVGYFQNRTWYELADERVVDEIIGRWSDRITRRPGEVAVHLRLGDYLDLGHAPQVDFYNSSIDRILAGAEIGGVVFVGQEEATVKDHGFADLLHALCQRGISVEYSNGSALEDLMLLAGCQHAVIGNSTFAWWGARIGDGLWSDKPRFVMCPRPWFSSRQSDLARTQWR